MRNNYKVSLTISLLLILMTLGMMSYALLWYQASLYLGKESQRQIDVLNQRFFPEGFKFSYDKINISGFPHVFKIKIYGFNLDWDSNAQLPFDHDTYTLNDFEGMQKLNDQQVPVHIVATSQNPLEIEINPWENYINILRGPHEFDLQVATDKNNFQFKYQFQPKDKRFLLSLMPKDWMVTMAYDKFVNQKAIAFKEANLWPHSQTLLEQGTPLFTSQEYSGKISLPESNAEDALKQSIIAFQALNQQIQYQHPFWQEILKIEEKPEAIAFLSKLGSENYGVQLEYAGKEGRSQKLVLSDTFYENNHFSGTIDIDLKRNPGQARIPVSGHMKLKINNYIQLSEDLHQWLIMTTPKKQHAEIKSAWDSLDQVLQPLLEVSEFSEDKQDMLIKLAFTPDKVFFGNGQDAMSTLLQTVMVISQLEQQMAYTTPSQHHGCVDYYLAQQYQQAQQVCLMQSQQQNTGEAERILGLMYLHGLGVYRDHHRAEVWLSQGANYEDIGSLNNLAKLYLRFGQVEDYPKAVGLLQKAEALGSFTAAFELGLLHEAGQGTNKDLTRAFGYYRTAAKRHHRGAQYNLGRMYFEGVATTKDNQQAKYWLLLAAHQGHPLASDLLQRVQVEDSSQSKQTP